MAKDDEIRLIAYNIWEQQGCPAGKDCENWIKAESIWDNREKSILRQQRNLHGFPGREQQKSNLAFLKRE